MKMKFKSTTLNPKALLYKRYTAIEKSFGLETIYKTYDGKYWFFDKEALTFIPVPPQNIDFVEYVESDGTQFIETDYSINEKTSCEITVSNAVPPFPEFGDVNRVSVFGSTNFYIIDYANTSDSNSLSVGFATYNQSSTPNTSAFYCSFGKRVISTLHNEPHPDDRKYTIKLGASGLDVDDGTTKSHFDYSKPETGTKQPQPKACIFNEASGGDDYVFRDDFASCKLYELKVYEDGVLVRHFLPFVDKVTGEAGLYEAVKGNTFFSHYNKFISKRNPLSANGANHISVLTQPKNAKIINVESHTTFMKYYDNYFKYSDQTGWSTANGTEGYAKYSLISLGFSNIGKYQVNNYYFAGSFDWTKNGSESGTTGQYIKGNIMPLKSFNIKYFTDDLEICEDDLIVIEGKLYSVENTEITDIHTPKHFKIYFATLNSIL